MRLSTATSLGATSLDWKVVLGVLALALVLRVVCLERSHLIGADASRFLRTAEQVEQGRFGAAIQDSFHPLTSFATGGANWVQNALLGPPDDFRTGLQRRERAGHLVVLTTGLLLVWSLMNLVGLLFPGLSPLWVGVLVACQPYFVRSSADIMSDMPCLAFFVFALWQGAVAAREPSARPIVLAGAAVGLAYLARPEGLLAALAIALYWLLRERRAWPRVLWRVAALGVVTAAVMSPYVAAISSAAGRPTLTMKKSVPQMIGIPDGARSTNGAQLRPAVGTGETPEPWQALQPAVEGKDSPALEASIAGELPARALGKIFVRWYTTAPEVIAVAFVIGLVNARRREDWRDGKLYVGICAALMVLVLFRLMTVLNDPSYIAKRHVFVLVALTLPFAAHGLGVLGPWLAKRLGLTTARRAGAVAVAIVALVLAGRGVGARRLDDMAQLEAADWILEHYGRGEVIYTDREKIPYYSGGEWRPLAGDAQATLQNIQSQNRAWVAFYPRRLHFLPEFRELAEEPTSGLQLVRTFEEPERSPGTLLNLYLWERERH